MVVWVLAAAAAVVVVVVGLVPAIDGGLQLHELVVHAGALVDLARVGGGDGLEHRAVGLERLQVVRLEANERVEVLEHEGQFVDCGGGGGGRWRWRRRR